eukprot:scaffold367745_cov35-Prasinocladus_malaysianus.AAC.1
MPPILLTTALETSQGMKLKAMKAVSSKLVEASLIYLTCSLCIHIKAPDRAAILVPDVARLDGSEHGDAFEGFPQKLCCLLSGSAYPLG